MHVELVMMIMTLYAEQMNSKKNVIHIWQTLRNCACIHPLVKLLKNNDHDEMGRLCNLFDCAVLITITFRLSSYIPLNQ